MTTIKDIKTSLLPALSEVSPTPENELDTIISDIIDADVSYIYSHPNYRISKEAEARIVEIVNRRKRDEPLAYILGYTNFYGFKFKLTPDVLIPRAETEILVDIALKELELKLEHKKNVNILDIGTGSGCVIISIAKLHNTSVSQNSGYNVNHMASDISRRALDMATLNARDLLSDEEIIVDFRHGDLLSPFKSVDIDIITANLPYIPSERLGSLPESVKSFEPVLALDGGNDGLLYILEALDEVKTSFPHSTLILEVDDSHYLPLEQFLIDTKHAWFPDLAGVKRFVKVEFSP